jgi:hypothetical protein
LLAHHAALIKDKTTGIIDDLIAIGGTAQAQAVFPRLGFEVKPKLPIVRKVLAPFHRLRTTGQGLFRRWAGTVKDMASVWRARTPPVPQLVELRSAPTFTKEIDCLQRQSSLRIVTCQPDHLLFNYFLRRPLSGFSGWTIHTSQKLAEKLAAQMERSPQAVLAIAIGTRAISKPWDVMCK